MIIMSSKSTSTSSKFQEAHRIKDGLSVTARDPESGLVTSCVCLFCVVFGREERIGARLLWWMH
jgi:hypothetical protein